MAKTADTIAIYSRKSRYTGKGESIGNQIDLCREYIRTHYGDAAAEHAVVFEDEGFSGGNLNRPDFKKMMTAAKDRKFKAIVVYRLDRISRNISDFSSLIEELGRQGIKTKTGRSFTRFSIKSRPRAGRRKHFYEHGRRNGSPGHHGQRDAGHLRGDCRHRVAGLPVDQSHLPEKVLTHGMRGAGLGGSPFSVSKK